MLNRCKLIATGHRVRICLAAWLAAGILGFGVASQGRAYDDEGHVFCKWSYSGGWNLLYVPYQWDPTFPPTGAYLTAVYSAIGNWNGTATPVWFTYDANWWNSNLIAALPLGMSGPYGHTSDTCSVFGNERVATMTELNTSRLDTQGANFKQSVASHELGHFIGIRHSLVVPTVMYSNRDRDVVYTAYADDICGVNHRYLNNWPLGCWW